MALRVETNPLEAAYAALLSHGLDGAGEALRILVDEASKIERSYHLQAAPHERSEDRTLLQPKNRRQMVLFPRVAHRKSAGRIEQGDQEI